MDIWYGASLGQSSGVIHVNGPAQGDIHVVLYRHLQKNTCTNIVLGVINGPATGRYSYMQAFIEKD